MDRVEIRGGDDWRGHINAALHQATVLIALIGQRWLTLTDEWNRLRIDRDDDWVRRELADALNHGKRLIPLYVDDARRIARPEQVPKDLRGLIDLQAIMLTADLWEQGLLELMRRLESCGFALGGAAIPMPERRKKVFPLEGEVLQRIGEELPGWTVSTNYIALGPKEVPVPRTELYREYRFDSFLDAIRFMGEASPIIEEGQHHPRWENIWTTVRVWLSTWDIEFQPSSYDLKLARTLDDAYAKFRRRSGG